MVPPALPLDVLDIPDVPDVFTGPRRSCTVPDCSATSWKGLNITGQFWRCLEGSGGSNLSSEAGMCW